MHYQFAGEIDVRTRYLVPGAQRTVLVLVYRTLELSLLTFRTCVLRSVFGGLAATLLSYALVSTTFDSHSTRFDCDLWSNDSRKTVECESNRSYKHCLTSP